MVEIKQNCKALLRSGLTDALSDRGYKSLKAVFLYFFLILIQQRSITSHPTAHLHPAAYLWVEQNGSFISCIWGPADQSRIGATVNKAKWLHGQTSSEPQSRTSSPRSTMKSLAQQLFPGKIIGIKLFLCLYVNLQI